MMMMMMMMLMMMMMMMMMMIQGNLSSTCPEAKGFGKLFFLY